MRRRGGSRERGGSGVRLAGGHAGAHVTSRLTGQHISDKVREQLWLQRVHGMLPEDGLCGGRCSRASGERPSGGGRQQEVAYRGAKRGTNLSTSLSLGTSSPTAAVRR